jgi:hypothetical protein
MDPDGLGTTTKLARSTYEWLRVCIDHLQLSRLDLRFSQCSQVSGKADGNRKSSILFMLTFSVKRT